MYLKKNKFYEKLIDNIKTIVYALLIALIIRSLFFQPFYIPSSSMEPTLLIGDRIFVSKYSYGYSKHSFPFSPPIFSERILFKKPNYGDLIVFKTPADNRTDYIKRLIGLPGDSVQFVDGKIILNGEEIKRKKINLSINLRCGTTSLNSIFYRETLPNGVQYIAAYNKDFTVLNTDKYIVPANHYFFLGDNRDCSKDSRFLSSVGYVNYINIVGKAKMIFFSNDTIESSILKFWNWKKSLRLDRFFNIL